MVKNRSGHRPGFPLRVPGAWVTALSIGLGSLGGGTVQGRVTCGAVGTSAWRDQPAVGRLGKWYFGVQKRDWGGDLDSRYQCKESE